MKKFIIVVFVFLISSFSFYCFAQLKEVRGIQTRSILYDSESRPNKYGFEFKNENNYAVWIEAELWATDFEYITIRGVDRVDNDVRDTKNFTLGPGESYRWKCGDRMIIDNSGFHEKFYVKYTAYKAE